MSALCTRSSIDHISGTCLHTAVSSLSYDARVLTLGVSVLFFAACFASAWQGLSKYWTWFNEAALTIQADTCSRVNSTIHSLIIVPGIIYGLITTAWDASFEPVSSVTSLQIVLLITVGYFIFDLVVIIAYRVPRWEVFAVHHLAAAFPYVVYLFVPVCPKGLYILASFLLVEFTNFFLNAQVFLEQTGRGASTIYVFALYGGVVAWIAVRIINPIFLLYVLHFYTLPIVSSKLCVGPSVVCAYFIVFFCVFVFFHILVPEVRRRWLAYPQPTQVAKDPSQAKSLHINPNIPLAEDELALTTQSPSRIVIYEAREKAYEIERFVDRAVEMRFRRHTALPTSDQI